MLLLDRFFTSSLPRDFKSPYLNFALHALVLLGGFIMLSLTPLWPKRESGCRLLDATPANFGFQACPALSSVPTKLVGPTGL